MTAPLGFALPWPDRLIEASLQRIDELLHRLPPLTAFQRFTGLGLRGAAHVHHLLALLRGAIEAEDGGAHQRADFLWTELLRRLRACWHDDDAWARAGAALSTDGPTLRARFALEGVVIQHCAHVNARLADSGRLSIGDRGCAHAGWLERLLALDGDALQPARHLAPTAILLRVDALRHGQALDEAIAACSTLADGTAAAPEHAALLADLHAERALSVLTGGEGESARRTDAARLRVVLEPYEQARLKHPREIGFYRGLGRCHRVLGVCLANGGEMGEALGALRLARLYDPHADDIERDEKQVEDLLAGLQNQMSEMRRQLAAQPGAQLNAEGLRMQRVAEQGDAERARVDSSPLARALRRDFVLAHDREIWRVVGLAEPPDRWEERSEALRDALVPLFNDRKPASVADVPRAWAQVKAQQPLLADVDDASVEAFLRRRFFDESPPKPAAPQPPPPVPPAATPARRRSLEPAALWLFSADALPMKALAGVVLTVLLGLVGLYGRETVVRGQRDAAWQALQAGSGRGDPEQVLRAAEAYFSARP